MGYEDMIEDFLFTYVNREKWKEAKDELFKILDTKDNELAEYDFFVH